MKRQTAFKIAQVLGAIAMIVGVTSCVQRDMQSATYAWMVGALLYGGGRLAAWFADR